MDANHQASPRPSTAILAVYQMAVLQLLSVAEIIHLDQNILERLSKPKRAMIVAVPIRMDNGKTHTFIGYRVQHSLTSGPSKGGSAIIRASISAKSPPWRCG